MKPFRLHWVPSAAALALLAARPAAAADFAKFQGLTSARGDMTHPGAFPAHVSLPSATMETRVKTPTGAGTGKLSIRWEAALAPLVPACATNQAYPTVEVWVGHDHFLLSTVRISGFAIGSQKRSAGTERDLDAADIDISYGSLKDLNAPPPRTPTARPAGVRPAGAAMPGAFRAIASPTPVPPR